MKKITGFTFAIILLFTLSCKKDLTVTNPPSTTTDTPLTAYTLKIPLGWPKPYLPAYNPMTVEGVDLGRHLFYDSILSTNGRSCSFCHPQALSFTSSLESHGLDPKVYPNIPMLSNEAWNPLFGWDGVFTDADHIAIADFGPLFFNSNPYINTIISRLQSSPYYSYMFRRVFPGEDVFKDGVIQEKVAFACAQFARTLVNCNSKFDQVNILHTAQFTPAEARGYNLFFTEKADCFHCHKDPLFTDNGFHNTGSDSVFIGMDKGRYNVTGLAKDMGLFRSPTLRNIELTAPYMHDGRYKTLEEVIEHYNSGVIKTPTIDPIMTLPGKELGLQLTAQDKADLKAFLLTLTDPTMMSNPLYGKP